MVMGEANCIVIQCTPLMAVPCISDAACQRSLIQSVPGGSWFNTDGGPKFPRTSPVMITSFCLETIVGGARLFFHICGKVAVVGAVDRRSQTNIRATTTAMPIETRSARVQVAVREYLFLCRFLNDVSIFCVHYHKWCLCRNTIVFQARCNDAMLQCALYGWRYRGWPKSHL